MNAFPVSKVPLTRQKKGMKATVAVYVLAILLMVLSAMVSFTLTGHLNRVYATDYMCRMIGVFYDTQEYADEDMHRTLSSMEHVELITHFTISQALYIEDMAAKPEWAGDVFRGTPHYEGAPLTLVAGRALEAGEKNAVLVPSLISGNYLTDSNDGLLREKGEFIRGTELLGSEMALLYGDGNQKKPYVCRVVGVYDSFAMGMYACQIFLPQEDLDRINVEMGNPISPIPYILVDDYDNVPAVEAEIDALGLFHDRIKTPGSIVEVSAAIFSLGLLAGAAALFIGAAGVCITAAGAVRERRREIGMLKAMGYQNRHLRRIILLENGRVCLWAMLFALLISGGLLFGVWYILRPFLTTLFIGLSFSPLLFLAVFAASCLVILPVSLLAGLLAAMRAYAIPPAEAVRDEEG